jgi:hypothetical protein
MRLEDLLPREVIDYPELTGPAARAMPGRRQWRSTPILEFVDLGHHRLQAHVAWAGLDQSEQRRGLFVHAVVVVILVDGDQAEQAARVRSHWLTAAPAGEQPTEDLLGGRDQVFVPEGLASSAQLRQFHLRVQPDQAAGHRVVGGERSGPWICRWACSPTSPRKSSMGGGRGPQWKHRLISAVTRNR